MTAGIFDFVLEFVILAAEPFDFAVVPVPRRSIKARRVEAEGDEFFRQWASPPRITMKIVVCSKCFLQPLQLALRKMIDAHRRLVIQLGSGKRSILDRPHESLVGLIDICNRGETLGPRRHSFIPTYPQ